MNIKWIIAGILFCVLAVAFSRNPVEERRAAREKAMEGKDKLVESIKQYNSKTGEFAPSLLGGSKTTTAAQQQQQQKSLPAPAKYLPGEDPRMSGAKLPVKQAKPAEPEGYYPPPPMPAGQ